jgi:4-aminobutyrate aminotransferase/(S)-3-amino-2-methylpropionate transaminase
VKLTRSILMVVTLVVPSFSDDPDDLKEAIRTIEEHDLIGAARRIESIMLPRLRELQQRYPAIGDVRGRGAMLAVEVVTPGSTTPDPATTQAVAQACHQAGRWC